MDYVPEHYDGLPDQPPCLFCSEPLVPPEDLWCEGCDGEDG